jgi:hypothetical protein
MLGTKRILNQITRMRLYLRPQRLAHQDRRAVSYVSLARAGYPRHHCFYRPRWLACIQTLAGYGTMVGKKRSGL